MKKLWGFIALTGLFTGGCASVSESAPESQIDEAKVSAVERVARSRGVIVRWVNYPVKPQGTPSP
jgi:hypothetical protein